MATDTQAPPSRLEAVGSSTFGFLQKIGKSLMLPVSILPVAGILLGVVHAVASYAFGAFTTVALLLLVAIAVILVRPRGILRSAV